MKITCITFKVFYKPTLISNWLVRNDMLDRMTYDWVKSEITFYTEEDALAFSLAFKATRKQLRIEEMLEHEKD